MHLYMYRIYLLFRGAACLLSLALSALLYTTVHNRDCVHSLMSRAGCFRMEVASDGLDMDLLIVDASPVDSHVDVGRHLLTFWQSMDSRATLASAILTARGLGAWFDTSDRGASGASLVTRVVLLLVDMAAAVAVLSLRVRLAEERMAAR